MSCKCQHTINRKGSGRLDRYLKALDPNYAPIDNRNLDELLVLAKNYAKQIRYYDLSTQRIPNTSPTDKISWEEFFNQDAATIAACIGIIDTKQVKEEYDHLREQIDLNPSAQTLAALFYPILSILAELERWMSLVNPSKSIYLDITLAIDSNLKSQTQKLKAYELGYVIVDSSVDLNIDYSTIKNLPLWGMDEDIDPDLTIYKGGNDDERIRTAALYFDDIFLAFYGFLQTLVDKSDVYLNKALAESDHKPHMTLFLSFLKLFEIVKEQMNGITDRMLNYYYRDVLELEEKPSIPDRAHIIFELAKDVTEFKVEKGSLLDAGKDAGGKIQQYQTDNEIVLNQAKVTDIKTIFIEKSEGVDANGNLTVSIDEIFARPVANSVDGYGTPFETEYPAWPAFGKGRRKSADFKNICDEIEGLKDELLFENETRLGFAVASPQLVLQGGNRLAQYEVVGLSGLFKDLDNREEIGVSIKLTGTEDWLTIDELMTEAHYDLLKGVIESGKFLDIGSLKTSYFLDNDKLTVFLPEGETAIVGYDSEIHQGSFRTKHAVMQVLFGPQVNLNEELYANLKIPNSSIKVKVGSINSDLKDLRPNMDGLTELSLQNDAGAIDKEKVYDPFTPYPNMGKSLILGSNEIFNKPIEKLSVNLQLAAEDTTSKQIMAAATPSSFAMLAMATVNPILFKVGVRNKGKWDQMQNGESTSFDYNTLSLDVLSRGADVVKYDREELINYESYSKEAKKGFVNLEFNTLLRGSGNTGTHQIMQEYAEILKSKAVSLNYESTLDKLDPEIDQIFHIYPFGVLEAKIEEERILPDKKTARKNSSVDNIRAFKKLDESKGYLLVDTKNKLLPQFTYLNPNSDVSENYNGKNENGTRLKKDQVKISKEKILQRLMIQGSGVLKTFGMRNNQYSNAIQEEGLLMIGMQGLKPQQTLSLLFQFADGTAEDTDNDPPEIHWSYLSNNEWHPLEEARVISDSTFGFQTTGIVKFDIPEDITNNNTIITERLFWLKASVTEHSKRIPMLVDIVAQAVVASFIDQNNDQSHFDQALPASTISKLVNGTSEVKSVNQPFASWNGKAKEEGKEFYMRVSERLRHKDRAINAWDYEYLVLNRFPSIFKVKCFTHTDPNCLCREPIPEYNTDNDPLCCGPQIAPGHVMLIPIANLQQRNAIDPLKPKTNRRTLLEIEEYVKKRISPFVRVHAKNPVYEEVIVFFRVKFHEGLDKGYYLKQLNEELVQYLTPWAFDGSIDVQFGQKIYASNVIDFIEEREYVDFITDFLMTVCKDPCCVEKENHPIDPYPVDEDSFEEIDTGGRPVVQGTIYDAQTREPLVGVNVIINGTTTGTVTDVNGSFMLLLANEEATISISYLGYSQKSKPVKAATKWEIYMHKAMMRDVTAKDIIETQKDEENETLEEIFSRICGCEDVEREVSDGDFLGETVVAPSTARSLLVSVPKHIIIPLTRESDEDLCQKRKLNQIKVIDKPIKDIELPDRGEVLRPIEETVVITGNSREKAAKAKAKTLEKSEGEVKSKPSKAETKLSTERTLSEVEKPIAKKTVKSSSATKNIVKELDEKATSSASKAKKPTAVSETKPAPSGIKTAAKKTVAKKPSESKKEIKSKTTSANKATPKATEVKSSGIKAAELKRKADKSIEEKKATSKASEAKRPEANRPKPDDSKQ